MVNCGAAEALRAVPMSVDERAPAAPKDSLADERYVPVQAYRRYAGAFPIAFSMSSARPEQRSLP